MLNINMLLMSAWVTGLLGLIIGLAVAVPVTFFVIQKINKKLLRQELSDFTKI